jgi:hypothetical protein
MAAGTVHIPFYATVFRADAFEDAVKEIAPRALRYGATRYFVFRGGDDRYRFSLYLDFDSKSDWEAFWYGPEFVAWRSKYTSWYQIPVVYDWGSTIEEGRSELLAAEDVPAEAVANGS